MSRYVFVVSQKRTELITYFYPLLLHDLSRTKYKEKKEKSISQLIISFSSTTIDPNSILYSPPSASPIVPLVASTNIGPNVAPLSLLTFITGVSAV
jgi:hypothetical protein